MTGNNRYHIFFFTGTGCTALAARSLEKALHERGCETRVERITASSQDGFIGDSGGVPPGSNTLILLFPVYACTAPGPVMEWIKTLGQTDGLPAAVISISGGGEVFPNTASRVGAKKSLKQKGFDVFFEDTIIMPSNISVATPEHVSVQLIKVLPEKAGAITDRIIKGAGKKKPPLIFDRFLAWGGQALWPFAKRWGKKTIVSSGCDGCGLCAAQCPTGNIAMAENMPVFNKRCCMCLGCFYTCPKRALEPKTAKSLILKRFNLKELEEKAKSYEKSSDEPFPKGYLWSGVKKYLSE